MDDIRTFKTYSFFPFREIKEIIPEFIYYYMFAGMSLKQIEEQYYGSQEYKGWLLKSLLNYYGIDTDGDNRGIYNGREISDVVEELSKSTDLTHLRVAKILKDAYL